MSQARFLCYHDFNQKFIEGLQRAESLIELTTLRSLQLDRLSDDEVLSYAAQHGMLVLSHDRNTMTAAAGKRVASRQPMLGLFIIQQQSTIVTQYQLRLHRRNRWTSSREYDRN